MTSISSKSVCRQELLITGYTRYTIAITVIIPLDIIQLILIYYIQKFTVYACGRNMKGEWGISKDTDNIKNGFSKLHRFSELIVNPLLIVQGNNRFSVSSYDNIIYSSGSLYGSGIEMYGKYLSEFTPMTMTNITFEPNEFITAISDGYYLNSTYFVTNKNRIFIAADKKPPILYKSKPSKYTFAQNIIQIATGSNHALFLGELGKVWAIGSNRHGQCNINRLGLGDDGEDVKLVDVACGDRVSLAVADNGDLYIWGRMQLCGVPDADTGLYGPSVHSISQVVHVAARGKNVIVITAWGKCWTWGKNGWGQIGNGETSWSVTKPSCIQSMEAYQNVKVISGDMGEYHVVLLDEDKERIWTFGNNKYHQCSRLHHEGYPQCVDKSELKFGNENDEWTQIERVIAGEHCTMIVVSNDNRRLAVEERIDSRCDIVISTLHSFK